MERNVCSAPARMGGRLRCASLLLAALIGALDAVHANSSVQRPPIGPAEPPAQCPTNLETVTDAEQLKAALSEARNFTGTIFIPAGTTIHLGETRGLAVRSCVTIKSTRGGLDPGALILATNRNVEGAMFEVGGQYVRIEGLLFRGPVTTDNRDGMDHSVRAIGISGDARSVQIDNNAFEFWSVAVDISRGWPDADSCQHQPPQAPAPKASLISITRNYFNRNAISRLGYGVGVMRGCATIEGNLFNKNRHAVAARGDTTYDDGTFGKGYIARYNYVLEGGFTESGYWNQHFDAHGDPDNGGYGGTAGEYFEIAWNTIRGEQTHGIDTTRPAFMLRGKPTSGAYFHDNVVVHDNAGEAVRLKKPGEQCAEYIPPGGYHYSNELCNLHVGPNLYNIDTHKDLAVGDFDGDRRDDIFLANGTGWWYSSAGRTEWRFLQPSTLRVSDLRFGRFDSDARTDVLFSQGQNWWISSGGARLPRMLRSDGARVRDCVFGDFDGDGLTDALRADGSTWSVAYGAASSWQLMREDARRANDLRVGDFTGDGIDEVFWIESDKWHLWHPTVNLVSEDVAKPVRDSDMARVVVADFDGDGLADLAKTDGDGWLWLRGGMSVWAMLREDGGQPEYSDIRAALFGHFTLTTVPYRRLNAIRYASARFPDDSRSGFALWYGTGTQDAFAAWSPHWQEMR